MRSTTPSLALLTLLAVACSEPDPPATIERAPLESAPPEPATAVLPEPEFDSQPPPVLPGEPSGAFGFSRYVFAELDGKVITTLVEGPKGKQIRCQREDLPCSYLELVELHESGAPIPPELEMTPEELALLVEQLGSLSDTLARYPKIEDACADGYFATSEQNPNMGIHMVSPQNASDGVFDPAKPEMLLFAMEGGDLLHKDEVGKCKDGHWTGDERHEIVGAAFMLPTSEFGEDHPEGFAGPIDNWHVHYWSCTGTRSDLILSPEACRARGGHMIEKAGWMVHAYAEPDFDNQLGVFAMWNERIWPRVDEPDGPARDSTEIERVRGDDAFTPIEQFSFGAPIEVSVGESITFQNLDRVPHSVVAGQPGQPTGAFGSDSLETGDLYTMTLHEPGEHAFYCEHHSFMRSTVIVR